MAMTQPTGNDSAHGNVLEPKEKERERAAFTDDGGWERKETCRDPNMYWSVIFHAAWSSGKSNERGRLSGVPFSATIFI